MTAEWRVDPDALELAEQRLQLKRGVKITMTDDLTEDAARYRGIKGGKHDIAIGRELCVWEAGEALWHELTHAQQCEQDGRKFWREYRSEPDRYEESAEKNERLNALIPLCKPC